MKRVKNADAHVPHEGASDSSLQKKGLEGKKPSGEENAENTAETEKKVYGEEATATQESRNTETTAAGTNHQRQNRDHKPNDTEKTGTERPVMTASPDGKLEVNEEAAIRKLYREISEVLSEQFTSALIDRFESVFLSKSPTYTSLENHMPETKQNAPTGHSGETTAGNDNNDALKEAYLRGKNEAIESRWEGFRDDDETSRKREKIEKMFRRRTSVWE